jgi:hypothetical protein
MGRVECPIVNISLLLIGSFSAIIADEGAGMRLLTTTRQTVRDHLPLIALLIVAFAIRLPLLPLWAYLDKGFNDEGFWKNWMVAIHQHGLLNIFRTTDTDYVGYH